MTRYFMRDTPLCQLEQQMMTPPYFKPRGHGRYYPSFKYSRDDMECPYCMNFRRKHPCPLEQCICLDERIVAGAIDLNEFVRDCFFPEVGVQLQARLERSFNGCSIGFFLSDSHRERWQHWRARCYRMSDRDLAALFLLTAYEDMKKLFKNITNTAKTAAINCQTSIAAFHRRAVCGNAGEGYIDTAVKVLIAVVLGALVLAGLYAVLNDTVMPTVTQRIQEMFNYAG